MDETLFVPLYTSTLQDGAYGSREVKRVAETEELSSEQNFKEAYHLSEMKNRNVTELTKKHDCSFDRYFNYVCMTPISLRPVTHLNGNMCVRINLPEYVCYS